MNFQKLSQKARAPVSILYIFPSSLPGVFFIVFTVVMTRAALYTPLLGERVRSLASLPPAPVLLSSVEKVAPPGVLSVTPVRPVVLSVREGVPPVSLVIREEREPSPPSGDPREWLLPSGEFPLRGESDSGLSAPPPPKPPVLSLNAAPPPAEDPRESRGIASMQGAAYFTPQLNRRLHSSVVLKPFTTNKKPPRISPPRSSLKLSAENVCCV